MGETPPTGLGAGPSDGAGAPALSLTPAEAPAGSGRSADGSKLEETERKETCDNMDSEWGEEKQDSVQLLLDRAALSEMPEGPEKEAAMSKLEEQEAMLALATFSPTTRGTSMTKLFVSAIQEDYDNTIIDPDDVSPPNEEWSCKVCTKINVAGRQHCVICGRSHMVSANKMTVVLAIQPFF